MANPLGHPRDDGASANQYLGATPLIDSDHPDVRAVSMGIAAHAGSQRDVAVAIHDFVRDHVLFGFTAMPHEMKASEVLECRRGFSLTKGALLVAMLRAAGIPARLRFMEISSDLVRGILVTYSPFIAHCIAEVWLGGCWIRIDSHVVDPRLLASARRRLGPEAALLGYGVHRHATSRWDGRRESFSQLVHSDSWPIEGQDFGVLEDARRFQEVYEVFLGPRAVLSRIVLSVAMLGANGRIDRIRRSGDPGSPA